MDEQRTEEWFKSRLGKVTASKVADVMKKTKSGYSTARKNYMMQLLCERLTETKKETYTNSIMQRGTDLEPIARFRYEVEAYCIVDECGLIDHATIPRFGASPDGLVDDDGLLEIKCPNTAQHIDFIINDKIIDQYMWQMMAQMSCSNRKWCDFVSFDDRLPEILQYKVKRIFRDEEKILSMEIEISNFLDELQELVEKITIKQRKMK